MDLHFLWEPTVAYGESVTPLLYEGLLVNLDKRGGAAGAVGQWKGHLLSFW